MSFPSNPTNGQTTVQNGVTFTYNSTKEEIVMASTLPSALQRHEEALAKANLGPIPGL